MNELFLTHSPKPLPKADNSMSHIDPSQIRTGVLKLAHAGKTVHIACAFSIAEIVSVLYSEILRFPNNDPEAPGRDYFVLSKGHGVMAQYICLADRGWISKRDMDNYFRDASNLPGLSESRIPGCEVSSGSLGHGLPIAAGLALASKLSNSEQLTFVLVGDGEMNEGTNWEAMLFAHHKALDNLIVIVDQNGFQAMGTTAEVLDMGSLEAKFHAFGFDVETVDGHDTFAITKALNEAKNGKNGRPKAIVAKTIKGAGVSFMEMNNRWHYTRLDDVTYASALSEIQKGL
jgi:transketolase